MIRCPSAAALLLLLLLVRAAHGQTQPPAMTPANQAAQAAPGAPAAVAVPGQMPTYTIAHLQVWHDPINGSVQKAVRLLGTFPPTTAPSGKAVSGRDGCQAANGGKLDNKREAVLGQPPQQLQMTILDTCMILLQ